MKFNTAYDRKFVIGTINKEPSLTQQQFADEVNINNIIARYQTTGVLPKGGTPVFGDFSNIQDFQSAQDAIATAKQAFEALPPYLRRRFNNDPAQLLSFIEDDDNRYEAEKLGLVPKKEVKPTETPVTKAPEQPAEKPADHNAT